MLTAIISETTGFAVVSEIIAVNKTLGLFLRSINSIDSNINVRPTRCSAQRVTVSVTVVSSISTLGLPCYKRETARS